MLIFALAKELRTLCPSLLGQKSFVLFLGELTKLKSILFLTGIKYRNNIGMASFQAFGIFLLLVLAASLCHALQEGNFKINKVHIFQEGL